MFWKTSTGGSIQSDEKYSKVAKSTGKTIARPPAKDEVARSNAMCSIHSILCRTALAASMPNGYLYEAIARINNVIAHRGPDEEGRVI
jgi:hypothetical protein